MNREIKFRSWLKNKNKFIYDFTNLENNSFTENEFCVVEQSTGITCKNGKLIFEGDFIKIPDDYDTYGMNAGEVYEIFFNAGGFRCKPKINPKARGIWLEDSGEFEIVGNVHQNIELIY